MICGAHVVDEQTGRCVHVADDGGEPAVVPEIADGEAAGGLRSGDAWAGAGGDVGEGAVAIVVIKDARLLKSAAEMLAVDFGIDVSIDEEQVGPAIVIEIEKHGAPSEIFGVEAESHWESDIIESAIAVIPIERGGVVRKICFEDVELAVAVVIGNG